MHIISTVIFAANNRATNNKSGDDGLSEGAIIGIVVAVVLPSGVVITVVIFIGYRKKHSKIDNGGENHY